MAKLFILFAVGLCGLELASAGLFGQSSEQRLNNYLDQSKVDRNPNFLMDETVKLYKDEFATNETKDSKFARYLADVISLREASVECTGESLEIAARVAKKTRANLEYVFLNERLAEFMIANFMARLSHKCEKKFNQTIKQISAKIKLVDGSTLRRVQQLAGTYAKFTPTYSKVLENPSKSQPTTKQFMKDIKIPSYLRREMSGQIYDQLLEFAKKDRDLGFELGKTLPAAPEVFRYLYKKHFVDACADYLKTINEATFEDFFWYMERYAFQGSSSVDFLYVTGAWINLEVCKKVVDGAAFRDVASCVIES